MSDDIFIRYFNGEMDIYKYLVPSKNNILSRMSGDELLDFLYYLDKCFLDLRDNLGLDENVTFGLELEFEHLDKFYMFENDFNNRFNKDKDKFNKWNFKRDITLFNSGAEIASPILRDTNDTWDELEDICDFISMRAKIGKHCASQVNIGAHILGDNTDAWINFIKLWSTYENVIFRFLYGSYLSYRLNVLTYAKPISNMLWNDYLHLLLEENITTKDFFKRVKYYDRKKYALKFKEMDCLNDIKKGNVIEVRVPNGTLDPVIWQNNVNLLVKLFEYSKSNKFSDRIIFDRREKTYSKYSDLMFYDEIYLEQALELCDLIFDNNLDKIYFMRQYLKSFEVGHDPMIEVKPFTKKRITR